MTSFNGRVFEWQRGRQLAAIREPGLNVEFTYDHTGLRSSKTVNNITSYYIWAGGLLMARYTPARDELIAWHYDVNGVMLGFALTIDEETSYYFYVRNLQGDVVAVIDTDGIIVAWYEFDAWGNKLNYGGVLAYVNPITYRGYYWDWETSLFYLQSRYYCPQLRRFISADVFMDTGVGILGTNMFIYCNNDPVNHWDPDGFSTAPLRNFWGRVWRGIDASMNVALAVVDEHLADSIYEPDIFHPFSNSQPNSHMYRREPTGPITVTTRNLSFEETEDWLNQLAKSESRTSNAIGGTIGLATAGVNVFAGLVAGYGTGRLADNLDITGAGEAHNRIRDLRNEATNTGVRITYVQQGRITIITDIQPIRPGVRPGMRN